MIGGSKEKAETTVDTGIARDKAALILWGMIRRQRDKGQLGYGGRCHG